MKYRKKPVEVEAMQYTGDNDTEIEKFANHTVLRLTIRSIKPTIVIPMYSGDIQLFAGDYIARGEWGELEKWEQKEFEQAYEKVEGEDV